MILPVVLTDAHNAPIEHAWHISATESDAAFNAALKADNAPENIFAVVKDADGKVLATIYKKGIVATSNEISTKISPYLETHEGADERAKEIARVTGGTVEYAKP